MTIQTQPLQKLNLDGGAGARALPGVNTISQYPRGHLPVLDGVRGLAIMMVLLVHFVGSIVPTDTIKHVLFGVCSYGNYGVELFFVLSGFLITGILYDAREKPDYFRNFYMRRVLRIFPLYY